MKCSHWAAVDLKRGRLQINRALSIVDDELVWDAPKTARSRRTISIDDETVAVLKEHRKGQLEERVKAGSAWAERDLVFCDELGGELHPNRFTRAFTQAATRAGVKRIRLHDLRHTWATLALEAGVHPKVVSASVTPRPASRSTPTATSSPSSTHKRPTQSPNSSLTYSGERLPRVCETGTRGRMMQLANLDIDAGRLAEICERYGIAELSVFGSFATGRADPQSDVDLLYVLRPDSRIGWDIERLGDELGELFGRPVDLVSKRYLHRLLRDEVLRTARVLYAA